MNLYKLAERKEKDQIISAINENQKDDLLNLKTDYY
jgi:hypothetical protein